MASEKDIWVLIEHRDGEIHEVSLELLGEARRLAAGLGGTACALLLGHDVESLAIPLSHHGAAVVYLLDHPLLARYSNDAYTKTLFKLLQRDPPRLIFLGATSNGSDLAPRLAARLGSPLVTGCITVKFDSNGELVFTKSVYGGKAHSTLSPNRPGLCLATVRPGIIGLDRPDNNRQVEIIPIPVELSSESIRTRHLGIEKVDPSKIDIAEAEMVVAGGRGVSDKWWLIEELAGALGASIAGSRMAMDAGHVGRERIVGQSGKTIAPKLYLAVGISGASHHTAGIRDARLIVAINSDPLAPILRLADLGLNGQAEKVIPEIIKLLPKSGASSTGESAS